MDDMTQQLINKIMASAPTEQAEEKLHSVKDLGLWDAQKDEAQLNYLEATLHANEALLTGALDHPENIRVFHRPGSHGRKIFRRRHITWGKSRAQILEKQTLTMDRESLKAKGNVEEQVRMLEDKAYIEQQVRKLHNGTSMNRAAMPAYLHRSEVRGMMSTLSRAVSVEPALRAQMMEQFITLDDQYAKLQPRLERAKALCSTYQERSDDRSLRLFRQRLEALQTEEQRLDQWFQDLDRQFRQTLPARDSSDSYIPYEEEAQDYARTHECSQSEARQQVFHRSLGPAATLQDMQLITMQAASAHHSSLTPEETQAATAHMGALLSHNDYCIRCDLNTVKTCLDQGRIPTEMDRLQPPEAWPSRELPHRCTSAEQLKALTRNNFGTSGDWLTSAQFPTFGYLSDAAQTTAPASGTDMGPITLTLNKLRMKGRVTYTLGSCVRPYPGFCPASADDPSLLAVLPDYQQDLNAAAAARKEGQTQPTEQDAPLIANTELQFHGPVTLSDVDAITWNVPLFPEAEAARLADQPDALQQARAQNAQGSQKELQRLKEWVTRVNRYPARYGRAGLPPLVLQILDRNESQQIRRLSPNGGEPA